MGREGHGISSSSQSICCWFEGKCSLPVSTSRVPSSCSPGLTEKNATGNAAVNSLLAPLKQAMQAPTLHRGHGGCSTLSALRRLFSDLEFLSFCYCSCFVPYRDGVGCPAFDDETVGTQTVKVTVTCGYLWGGGRKCFLLSCEPPSRSHAEAPPPSLQPSGGHRRPALLCAAQPPQQRH